MIRLNSPLNDLSSSVRAHEDFDPNLTDWPRSRRNNNRRWIRLAIQYWVQILIWSVLVGEYYNYTSDPVPDPDPRLWWPKILQLKKFPLFLIQWRTSKLQEKPSAHKSEHPAPQNTFLIFVGHFCPPESGSTLPILADQNQSGSI